MSKVNIDWSGLASLNKDLIIRLRVPKSRWEELRRLKDVLMAEEIEEDGDYVIVDVYIVVVNEERILVNFTGQLLALAALAEAVEQL